MDKINFNQFISMKDIINIMIDIISNLEYIEFNNELINLNN